MTRFKGPIGAATSTGNLGIGQPGTDVVLMDGAITIGVVNIPLNNSYTLTNAALTRNAANDVSINVAAGQNAVIDLLCNEYFKQVNTLLSISSVPAINNSGVLADDSGDTPPSKGCMITALNLAYSVQGGPLTSIAVGLAQNAPNIGAVGLNVITTLIASAQNGLSLANTNSATSAPIQKIAVPVANQAFDLNVISNVMMEMSVVTPAGCTFRLYGVSLQVSFNFN